jgi:hypothetical protein
MKKIILGLALLVLTGCAGGKIFRFTDKPASISTNDVAIVFDVNCEMPYIVSYCQNLSLGISNKTNKNILINWNKSYYIRNNQTQGGFMYSGIQYLLRNTHRQNDIIFPNGSYTQILYPSNLVEFSSYASSGWIHNQLQLGNHGIYLTLIINDKEVEYKLNTELKEKLVLDK